MDQTIKTRFDSDNFESRRTTGHNMYDPEALLTGAEIEAGLGYQDKRVWQSQDSYDAAVSGNLKIDDIPVFGPRRKQNASKS